MSKWIAFELTGQSPSGKTLSWEVVTKDHGATLGRIAWWAPWRKYAYFPRADTVYEQTCLRDIAMFIDHQMKLRKPALAQRREGEGG